MFYFFNKKVHFIDDRTLREYETSFLWVKEILKY